MPRAKVRSAVASLNRQSPESKQRLPLKSRAAAGGTLHELLLDSISLNDSKSKTPAAIGEPSCVAYCHRPNRRRVSQSAERLWM
jgi:hypothetical protein